MTSKLQVTLPKALATQYRIRPGDEILWVNPRRAFLGARVKF